MIFIDCYRAPSSDSSKVERRVVVYKSARAARSVLHDACRTFESRRLISEDHVADVVLEKIDAEGFCDVGASVIGARLR